MERIQETMEIEEKPKMCRNLLSLTIGEIEQLAGEQAKRDSHLIKLDPDALAAEKMKRFGIKEFTDHLLGLNKNTTYYFEEPKRKIRHYSSITDHIFDHLTRSPLDKKYIARYLGREGERYRYVSLHYYNAGNKSLADYFKRLSVLCHQEARNVFDFESNHVSNKEDKQDGQVNIGRHLAIKKHKRFKNIDVIQMLKDIYRDNCGAAIEKEEYLNEHLTGFLLAIYEMEKCDTSLTTHYHTLFVKKLKNTNVKICALGTYQRYIRTYNRLKNSEMTPEEENTFNTWAELKAMYLRGIKERLA